MSVEVRTERLGASWSGIAIRAPLWSAAALLALYLAGLASYLAAVVPFPYSIRYEDGSILNAALTLAQGGDIYKDNSSPPYVSAIYTPLYYLPGAIALALFGPNSPATKVPSLLGTIFLAILIYRWVSWRTSNGGAALVASGVLLTFYPVANYVGSTRVDALAVLFSLSGAYVVDRYSRKGTFWLAVPLFALAFLTKPTQLSAPLAAGIYLLAVSPARALRFGAAYLATVGIPFVMLDLLTSHGLYRHVIEYNAAQPHWIWRAKQMLKSYLLSYGGYLILASIGASASLLRPPRFPLLVVYLATSLLATAWALTSPGSDLNHLMEVSAVASVLVGIGLGHAPSLGIPWLRLACGALLAAQLLLRVPSILPEVHVPWLASMDPSGRGAAVSEPPLWFWLPSAEVRATGDRLVAELSAAEGPVLVELPAYALLAGRRVEMDDPYEFTALSQAGAWSQDRFVQELRAGEFALLALLVDVRPQGFHHTRLTDEMIEAIRTNYRIVASLPYQWLEGPRIYLYRPIVSAGDRRNAR